MYNPRTVDEIYESLKDRLTGRIEKLTNFVEGSFNRHWTTSFSEFFRQNEEAILASQLSGMVDYAGGPITDEQLSNLDIEGVTAEDINEYLSDEDLTELVKLVGVDRRPGQRATGQVEIEVYNSGAVVPEDTPVGTQPDSEGNYRRYELDEDVSPDGNSNFVLADVTAVEPGDEFNAGTGRVDYMPNPTSQMANVTNPEPISGGQDSETNESLRKRAKNSIVQQSGGGTVRGIENYVVARTDAIEANIEEFPDVEPPYADVIVDGGKDEEIEQAIFESHPSGVRHNFVRPTVYLIDVRANIEGTTPDTTRAANAVRDKLHSLALGEDVIEDQLRAAIMMSSSDVSNIKNYQMSIANEPHTFNYEQDTYFTNKVYTEVTSITVGDGNNGTELVKGEDWTEGSGEKEITITVALDDQADIFFDYNVDEDIIVDDREKATTNVVDITEV